MKNKKQATKISAKEYTKEFKESVARGIADADAGRVMTGEEMERRVLKLIKSKRNKKK
jgi:predicted transcriptional regulator